MTRQAQDDESSRRWPRTVIFLGAGASAADGAPVQSELLKGFFSFYRSRNLSGHRWHLRANLAHYFWDVWGVDVHGKDVSAARFPTFEETLGLLELARERGESFRGLGGANHQSRNASQLSADFIGLIAMYLQETLRDSGSHHRNLASGLIGRAPDASVTFISLNYDLLIDSAVSGTAARADFGVCFSNNSVSLPFGQQIPLLKLHGSLNWLFCPTCNALDYYPERKAAADLSLDPHFGRCGRCQESRVPIIIPPTFFKVMSNFYLQQIWKRAEEELKQAARIVFCGYSFPDADMHIKYLLKRAEVNRTGLPPTVFIVNEHKGKTDQQREMEKDRYLRFFRQKEQVHWTDLSFEEFAGKPQAIEDESRWQ